MWRSGVAIAFVCAALAGCAGASIGPRNGVPSAELADAARIDGIPAARAWGDFVPGDVATAIRQAFPGLPPIGANAQRTPDGRTVLDTLALSGGGGDGAYGAGLLVGWTKAGTRPEFEIVTGVSAGALTAPFAFLGPEYDPMLRELWTAFSTRELIVPRGLGGLLQGDALTDTAPLAQLIARYMNDAALAKIAAQYARGRALVVLTTNLDAQRPVVWNMGAIAASSDPRAPTLFRQVLLASAAIPSVFPPVNIDVVGADGKAYEELHVDGGITANMFISPFPVPLTAYNALYDRPPVRRIWVIKNGRTA
ncbi:MAG: patatin-like phospholipase family protein, partial [Pseudomonadota bacterium]